MNRWLTDRYGLTARRAASRLLPPKPTWVRLARLLRRAGMARPDPDPYLYELAPLQQFRDCHPLKDPPFVPVDRAGHMRDDDDVIGICLEGDARAYPWWILDNHHVANDLVGGQPVTVVL